MPPWLADPHFGPFRIDPRLSRAEIDTLVSWANSGASEGDSKDLPPAPDFEEGRLIGKPDTVLALQEELYRRQPESGVAYVNVRNFHPGNHVLFVNA